MIIKTLVLLIVSVSFIANANETDNDEKLFKKNPIGWMKDKYQSVVGIREEKLTGNIPTLRKVSKLQQNKNDIPQLSEIATQAIIKSCEDNVAKYKKLYEHNNSDNFLKWQYESWDKRCRKEHSKQ